jgi:hypothetical protein
MAVAFVSPGDIGASLRNRHSIPGRLQNCLTLCFTFFLPRDPTGICSAGSRSENLSIADEWIKHLMDRLSCLATDPHIPLLLTLRQGRAIPGRILAKRNLQARMLELKFVERGRTLHSRLQQWPDRRTPSTTCRLVAPTAGSWGATLDWGASAVCPVPAPARTDSRRGSLHP